MAHDPSDTRLRRAPLGKHDPPVGTKLGSTTITAPLEVDRADPQVIHGTSNAAMDKAAGAYKDTADVAKPDRPPVHPGGVPFTLSK